MEKHDIISEGTLRLQILWQRFVPAKYITGAYDTSQLQTAYVRLPPV